MKTYLIAAAALLFASAIEAKVVPSPICSDNAVLQQNSQVRLFGKATPGSKVSVTGSWNKATHTTSVDKDGLWMLTVATPSASFDTYTIEYADGDSQYTAQNILIGEVWLAAGQSNMEMPLKGFPGCCVKDGYDEIATSRRRADQIRFLTPPLRQSYEPVDTTDTGWEVPSPETAKDFSATAWFFASRLADVLDIPVGIVNIAYGGSKVEGWLPKDILENYSDIKLDPEDIKATASNHRPMMMYNAMFRPVKDYTYKGIIWYQGCSNVPTYATYAERLRDMVARWRSDLNLGDIPFYAVEIAPYQYGNDDSIDGAKLRTQQWNAIEMIPNSDMICTNDLVEPYERFNIHPGNKSALGKRLGDLALNKTYGKTTFLAGSPRYKSHKFQNGEAWVSIDSPNFGICRNYDIRGFEVAGEDRVFHPADNAWLHWQTNEIVVSSKDVPNPVAVRYGYRDFLPGTLHAGNYLPLIPFRTDSW